MNREAPLAGIRVLDLTRVLAGPYCSLLLSQLGAEVIKIEEPSGDHTRTLPPFRDGSSVYFYSLNYNKKSVVLDLKAPEGRDVFMQLAERSDVVLENFRPGVMSRLGIGHEDLAARNPRIVTCSISGFGQDTTWRNRSAYDLTIQALGGLMSITGEPGRPPARCGYAIGDLAGGVFATIAILAALQARTQSGQGQAIDLSLLDVQMALMTYFASGYLVTGEQPPPMGSGHPSAAPYRAFWGSDRRPFVVAVFSEGFWGNLCETIGRPELRDDPRFRTNRERLENRAELEAMLDQIFASAERSTWIERLDQGDVPCAPVHSLGEAIECPPLVEREMIQSYHDPGIGEVKVTGNPFRFSAHPRSTPVPAPRLGEHTREVLQSILSLEPQTLAQLEARGVIKDAQAVRAAAVIPKPSTEDI